jgi:hypothetical protein
LPSRPPPDLSTLPPAIAASLAKLAGIKPPPPVEAHPETRVPSNKAETGSA